ncbi:hypothetical protein CYMTET_23849, partial [Cymbomonas tetramitiformis]
MLFAGSEARVTDSACEGNSVGDGWAGMGGAVATMGAVARLQMHSVALSGNQGHHGTVYIGQPGALTEPAVLQELHFGNASMPIAGCVFSTFQPGVDPPECVNCTHNAATPLHVTTPASYKLTQADQVVTEVNLASNTSVLGVIAGENLETLTPAVHYVATDYYGQVCLPSSVTTVTAQMDAGLIAGGNARVVSGSLEMYGREGAVFDDMMLAGLAGGSYLVHFVPVESEWAGLALEVAIAPCESGDYYDGTSFTCKQCEAGTLKFANDEEPCVSCEGRNVTCPGGDAFVLEDGYWLANAAVRADCLVNDTECVLEKVQRCDYVGACTSEEGHRGNANGSLTVATDALCAQGYANSVVLCGSCVTGFEMLQARRCRRCPEIWEVWTQLLGLLLSTAFFLRLVVHFPTTRDLVLSKVNGGQRSRVLLSIAVNHLQVLSQQLGIFGDSVVPEVFQQFLYGTQFLGLNMRFNGQSCLLYHFSEGSATQFAQFGHFYASVWLHALLPIGMTLFVIVMYTVRSSISASSTERRTGAEDGMSEVKDVDEAEDDMSEVKDVDEAEDGMSEVKDVDGAEDDMSEVKDVDGAEDGRGNAKDVDGAEDGRGEVKDVDGADGNGMLGYDSDDCSASRDSCSSNDAGEHSTTAQRDAVIVMPASVSIATFLLEFMHPSIAACMFQARPLLCPSLGSSDGR